MPSSLEVKAFYEFVAKEMVQKLNRFKENRTPTNYLAIQKDVLLMISILNSMRQKELAKLRLDSIGREESDMTHPTRLANTRLFVLLPRGRGLPYIFVLNPTPPPPPQQNFCRIDR
jgi:hypothetical protein